MNKPDVLTEEELRVVPIPFAYDREIAIACGIAEAQRDDTFKKTVRAVLAWMKEDCSNQSHKIHRFDLHSNPKHIDCLECWAELLKEVEG